MSIKSFFNNIWVKNGLAFIAVIALLYILIFYSLNSCTKHGESVVVPDVKGVTEAEAAPLLNAMGLRYEIVDEIFIKGKTPGVICEQIPMPGVKVKPNRIIYLTINSFSPKQIELPDVRNISLREAEIILKSKGFEVASVEYAETGFKDEVLKVKKGNSVVYPGAKFADGTRLTLEIGSGADSLNSDSAGISSESDIDHSFNDDSWF